MRTSKASRSTDVYAFGAFLLEVACGRRPIELRDAGDLILVDWVFSCWDRGAFSRQVIRNGGGVVGRGDGVVLKLGLICSHSDPLMRPCMRQVLQYLERDLPLPELSSIALSSGGLTFAHREGLDDVAMPYPSSMYKAFAHSSSSVAESHLSGGR
ncbi:uncharacterized protein J3R85_006276 [Psidium guajava]|nr:uncharacterized protein J3R85_006276 [Psidium guajava]